MPTTYLPFRWRVGTFQEILDSSSGNWVRIKSITDLRVLCFVGSTEAKYSSTELNFGRLRERGWCIVLRFTFCDPLSRRLSRWASSPAVSRASRPRESRQGAGLRSEIGPRPAMKLVGGCPIQARRVPHSKFRVLREI